MVVEAMPDPVGLKMGVIVGISVDSQELIYQRFQCKNEAIFNISEITGEDISFYGGICFPIMCFDKSPRFSRLQSVIFSGDSRTM